MKLRSWKIFKLLSNKGDSSEVEDCDEDSDSDEIPLIGNSINNVDENIESVHNDDSLHSIYNVCDKKDITWKKEPLRTNILYYEKVSRDIFLLVMTDKTYLN